MLNGPYTKEPVVPNKLKKGDVIGIVSPSAAVTPAAAIQLKKGREVLHNLGFTTVLSKNCLNEQDGSAGTPEDRADDINSMFGDSKVNAIICSQGGDTANSTLPYLDYNLIKENPKIFMGISDITVLLNTIQSKTGLVTFHGNDPIWGFGVNPTPYDTREFVDRLVNGNIGKMAKNSRWRSIREGNAEGRLMGGNLKCILKLAGTPYQPDFSNSILFLEAFEITQEETSYMLHQMKQMGIFDAIKGVLVGYVWGLQKNAGTRKKAQMEDILERTTSEFDFPIVKCNDFGHKHANTTIPLGVKARLNGTKKIPDLEILEKCVV